MRLATRKAEPAATLAAGWAHGVQSKLDTQKLQADTLRSKPTWHFYANTGADFRDVHNYKAQRQQADAHWQAFPCHATHFDMQILQSPGALMKWLRERLRTTTTDIMLSK